MLEGHTIQELGTLARNGASMDIDGSQYPPSDICELARSMTRGSVLAIHYSSSIPMNHLAQIARASGISEVRFL